MFSKGSRSNSNYSQGSAASHQTSAASIRTELGEGKLSVGHHTGGYGSKVLVLDNSAGFTCTAPWTEGQPGNPSAQVVLLYPDTEATVDALGAAISAWKSAVKTDGTTGEKYVEEHDAPQKFVSTLASSVKPTTQYRRFVPSALCGKDTALDSRVFPGISVSSAGGNGPLDICFTGLLPRSFLDTVAQRLLLRPDIAKDEVQVKNVFAPRVFGVSKKLSEKVYRLDLDLLSKEGDTFSVVNDKPIIVSSDASVSRVTS